MKKFTILILCLLFTKCNFLEEDDVLPKAVPYTGNQLKLNGYYYQISFDYIVRPFFMYSNGILIDTGGSEKSLEEMDIYIRKKFFKETWFKKNKYLWGVFYINDNSIIINRLSQDYPHRGNVRDGIIFNDTTFHITKFSSEKKENEYDEVYYFREFYPKPDSTNKYIK